MKRIFRVATKSIAIILLICLAISITTLRIITPKLNEHKAEIETWLQAEYGVELSAEKLSTAWHGFRPLLVLENLDIAESKYFIGPVKVKNLHLSIAVIPSLLKRNLVGAKLSVSGVNLKSNIAPSDNEKSFRQILKNLMPILKFSGEQDKIAFTDVSIELLDAGKVAHKVVIEKLKFTNWGNQHKFIGQISYGIDKADRFKLYAKAITRDADYENAYIKFYLSSFDVSQDSDFSREYLQPLGIFPKDADVQVWGEARNAELLNLQINTEMQHLRLSHDNFDNVLDNFSGLFNWQHTKTGWDLGVQINNADTNGFVWPKTYFEITNLKEPEANDYQLRASYLDLTALRFILQRSGIITAQSLLSKSEIAGSVRQLYLSLPDLDPAKASLSFEFDELSFKPIYELPGVAHLSGQLKWTPESGWLTLGSDDLLIEKNLLISQEMQLDDVYGDIFWEHQADFSQWRIPNLNFSLEQLPIAIAGEVLQQKNTAPELQIAASFGSAPAAPLSAYVPDGALPESVSHWLKNAFKAGKVNGGNLVLSGSTKDFPFHDPTKGAFYGLINAENITLNYDEHWPDVEAVDATVRLDQDSLFIDSQSATIMDATVTGAHAEVTHMGSAELAQVTVFGNAHGQLKRGVEFLTNSPLKDPIADALVPLKLNGDFELDLDLKIPIEHAATKSTVLGQIKVPDADMIIPDLDYPIDQIKGVFEFSEDSFSAKNIKAQLLKDIPLKVHAITERKKRANILLIEADAKLSASRIQQQLQLPILSKSSGASDFTGVVQLPLHGKAESRFTLTSDLEGIAFNLPAPFTKKAESKRQFILTSLINNGNKIDISYNKNISMAIARDSLYSDKPVKAQVLFGSGIAQIPNRYGLELKGKLDRLDLATWHDFIEQESSSYDSQIVSLIDIEAKKLTALGQSFPRTRFKIQFNPQETLVSLSGTTIAGKLRLPKNNSNFEAQFDRIYWNKSNSKGVASGDLLSKLPDGKYNLVCRDLRWDQLNLGRANIEARKTTTAINLERLLLENRGFNISSTGSYNVATKKSTWQGNLNSRDFGHVLEAFVATDAVDGGKGKISYNLSWPGTPIEFDLKRTSGAIKLDINDGRIRSVDAGVGKLLSILSISSLQRRLKLDFSDLFEKGFAFDSIKADLNLNSSSLTTNNARIDGPAADIRINGNMNLANERLNLAVKVLPKVTASLPLAAAIAAGNPAVGAAVWLLDKVFSPQIQEMAQYNYRVTGTLNNPKVN